MISVRPAAMTISEFRDWSRLGRTKTYELIASGALAAFKVGRRTYIRSDAADAWLAAQPVFQKDGGAAHAKS